MIFFVTYSQVRKQSHLRIIIRDKQQCLPYWVDVHFEFVSAANEKLQAVADTRVVNIDGIVTHAVFLYSCSRNTSRIFLYDQVSWPHYGITVIPAHCQFWGSEVLGLNQGRVQIHILIQKFWVFESEITKVHLFVFESICEQKIHTLLLITKGKALLHVV